MYDNAMIHFENPDMFYDFYDRLNIYGTWRIYSGKLNDRGFKIYDKSYTKKLRSVFNEKKLFRRNVSIAEIVSWLDNYIIIIRLFNYIESKVNKHTFSNIKILLEYKINFSKNRRVDMVLRYNDKILLVEFMLSSRFPNITNVWQRKEMELIIYKELLSNYIKNKDIIIYAFIAMPEYNKSEKIEKNIKYNTQNINYFGDYIIEYLLNER
ncbi:MAG: hypothetical protein ACOC2U_01395 [bacterium]